MARPRTYKDLQALADKAKAREAARAAQRIANPKAYVARKKGDYNTFYYYHPVTSNKGGAGDLLVSYSLKTAVVALVGAANCGLLTAQPANTNPIARTSLKAFPDVRLKWYAGDATVVAVNTTWGTRWIKKYDTNSTLGQSHFSLPFGSQIVADTLDDVIARFGALFNLTDGTKKEILGVNGYIELTLGKQRLVSFQADG